MHLSAEHSLSPVSIETLDSLVETTIASEELSQEDLFGFLLRTLEESDRRRVTRALLTSPENDRRLIEMDRELRQRMKRPLSEWPHDTLFRFVRSNIAHLFTTFGTIFRHESSSAGVRNPEIWRRLSDAAQRTRLLYANPAYATSRGRALTNRLYAEIGEEGALMVTAWASAEEVAHRKTALLSYVDPAGGAVPLEYAELREGAWKFRVAKFARTTEFPPGPLPEEFFAISFDTSEPNRLSSSAVWVKLPDGTISGWEINSPPQIKDGWFRMPIVVPSSVPQQFPKHRLELWVPLGDYETLLGTWPLSTLPPTFEIVIPIESSDTNAPIGTLIRLRVGTQADSLHEG